MTMTPHYLIETQCPIRIIHSNKTKNKNSLNQALTELQVDINELDREWQVSVNDKQKQEVNFLNDRYEKGIQKMLVIVGQINEIACELESLILKFKEIAVEVNKTYHLIQQSQDKSKQQSHRYRLRPSNIWEIHHSSIPTIIRRGAKFILSAKTIDMFPKKG